MAKARQCDSVLQGSRPTEPENYAELEQKQMIAAHTEMHYSPHRATWRHANDKIDQHHHYSTPPRCHAHHQLGSSRAAASPDAGNSSAGLNSSAKRKLVNENNDHSPGYDYDYDHDDTPKGPLPVVEKDATTNSLEALAPQNRNSTSKSSPKRMRSNEWLLKSREASASPSQAHGGGKKDSTNSRLRSRRRRSQGKTQHGYRSFSSSAATAAAGERRSRFLEGSMNDRVSEKPPSIYIGEDMDEAIDRYMTGVDEESAGDCVSTPSRRLGYGHAYSSSAANSMSSVATDTPSAKQSGLVRFGQVIASAFNPFGVWNNVSEIWNGPQDGAKTPTTSVSTGAKAHKDILVERQAQAEKAYAELKASGYQGTVKSTPASYRGHPSPEKSGVKKSKHLFFPDRTPQKQHKPVRSISSTFSKDSLLTPSKSAIRASFQDLRKAASSINLPLTPKWGDSVEKNNINDDDEDGNSNIIRKQASRRHLEKQRRLKKRVSNLESQLERAKKQLSMVSGEGDIGDETASASANGSVSMNGTEDDEEVDLAPPIPPPHREGIKVGQRKKFVPGVLPSLPSERILLDRMSEKVTNRPSFTGATPLSPRALDAEDGNASLNKLRKGKHAMNLAPATSSRRTSKSTLTSTTHQEEYHDNGTVTYPEKQVAPLNSCSSSRQNQATRKPKFQKPAPSTSFSASNIENIQFAPSFSSPHGIYDQPPSCPISSSKPRQPRRRRSSTTFPSHKHYHEQDHSAAANTNMDRSKNHKSQRNGSGAVRDNDDIPPVPPLPVSFVAGVNVRRRLEMKEEQVRKQQEFDWPEDFL